MLVHKKVGKKTCVQWTVNGVYPGGKGCIQVPQSPKRSRGTSFKELGQSHPSSGMPSARVSLVLILRRARCSQTTVCQDLLTAAVPTPHLATSNVQRIRVPSLTWIQLVKFPSSFLPPKSPTVRATWGKRISSCTKPDLSSFFAQQYSESPNDFSLFGST